MWLVSLGRKRCKDKERASWWSSCESCEERDVESRPGSSLAVDGSSFSEPVEKEKEGVVVSDLVSAAAGGY